MMKRLMCVTLAVATIAASSSGLFASKADDRITGSWQADLQGEGKSFSFVFHFEARADELTGTVEFPSQDREFPITEGKIRGNDLSFTGFGIWRGTITGAELSLTRELDGGKKQRMTAHRVRP